MKPLYCRLWLDNGQTIRSSTGVELRFTPSMAFEPLPLADSLTLNWPAILSMEGASWSNSAGSLRIGWRRLGPHNSIRKQPRSSGLSAEVMRLMPGSLQLLIFDPRSGGIIGMTEFPALHEMLLWGLRVFAAREAMRAEQSRQLEASLSRSYRLNNTEQFLKSPLKREHQRLGRKHQ